MCAVDAKPDFFASEQRTHARERKSEVSQCFTVTRMHDVDRLRRFSNDRQAELARRRGSTGGKRASFFCHSSSFSGQGASVNNVRSSSTVNTLMMLLKPSRKSATR